MKMPAPTLASALLAVSTTTQAALLNVVNPSFEDDPNNFNEFFLGEPNGWTLIDPECCWPSAC